MHLKADKINKVITELNPIQKILFENGLELYKLYTSVQVSADNSYLGRTGVITLTQGLLFLTVNTLLKENGNFIILTIISVIGALLSIMWFFFEQRNHAFFKARSKYLRYLEKRLEAEFKEINVKSYATFWNDVPAIVDSDSKWYEKASAQKILRQWLPLLFAVIWLSLGIYGILLNFQKNINNLSITSEKIISSDKETIECDNQ